MAELSAKNIAYHVMRCGTELLEDECDGATECCVMAGSASLNEGKPRNAYALFAQARFWAWAASNKTDWMKADAAMQMLRKNYPHEVVDMPVK